MPLVDSLLTAVVRSDGDALVLHVGEKPYVVASSGPVELSRQPLGLGAMEGMLAQMLTADALRVLREMGAVEHELEDRPASAGDRFTVVAARGGDDIWIEMRRHRRVAAATAPPASAPTPVTPPSTPPSTRVPEPPRVEAVAITPRPEHVDAVSSGEASGQVVPAPIAAAAAAAMAASALDVVPDVALEAVPVVDAPLADAPVNDAPLADAPVAEPVVMSAPAVELAPVLVSPAPWAPTPVPVAASDQEPVAPPTATAPTAEAAVAMSAPLPPPIEEADPMVAASLRVPPTPDAVTLEPVAPDTTVLAPTQAAVSALASATGPVAAERPQAQAPLSPAPVHDSEMAEATAPRASWPSPRLDTFIPETANLDADEQPVLPGLAPEYAAIDRLAGVSSYEAPESLPAVVLSLTRDGVRGNGGVMRGIFRPGGIERLLRVAAARGASALYLTTQARPAVRVDGDIRLLDGEPALSSGDVEAAVLELAPEGAGEKESAEWIRDLQDVGRVRITTFRDYRGPGALLRMIQARPTSAEQLGLVREIQALATEPEGLVLVTGPRASGKSTLMSAFVDLINRQRNDYVISLEGQIRLVHESRGSLISQRELRGSASDIVMAARSALRENPDVLVIEDLRSPDVLQVALDAAGSGLLVFASVTAASATAALERLVDLCSSEQRHAVRAGLAEHLRGVVAQVLLRKAGGGRLAARELVLNTSAVAALVGDGQLSQLPRAIDSGRKLGMAPLNDALVAFVQSGAVDVREAYRKADDKAGLLALLKREGIDTSFVERLA